MNFFLPVIMILILIVSTLSKAKQSAGKRPGARPPAGQFRAPQSSVVKPVTMPGMAAAPRAPQPSQTYYEAGGARTDMAPSARDEMQLSKRDELKARVASTMTDNSRERVSRAPESYALKRGAGARRPQKIDAAQMRRAVILSELLGKPLALREGQDVAGRAG